MTSTLGHFLLHGFFVAIKFDYLNVGANIDKETSGFKMRCLFFMLPLGASRGATITNSQGSKVIKVGP